MQPKQFCKCQKSKVHVGRSHLHLKAKIQKVGTKFLLASIDSSARAKEGYVLASVVTQKSNFGNS